MWSSAFWTALFFSLDYWATTANTGGGVVVPPVTPQNVHGDADGIPDRPAAYRVLGFSSPVLGRSRPIGSGVKVL
jgi:hypothetical protein